MRLIDADNLIEKLKSYAECDWNKSLCTMLPNVVDDCIEFVDEQPTAYSVDKVAEELKTDSSAKLYGSGNSDNYLIPVKGAIGIVKHGYIGKDVEYMNTTEEYKGCRNCKYQPEPMQTCEWLKHKKEVYRVCPMWELKENKGNGE